MQRFPFFPHSSQNSLSFDFLIRVILTDLRWYYVVLIFILLIICGVDYPFKYLLAISMSSLLKCTYMFLCIFLIGLTWISYLFWILTSKDIWFTNILFHSVSCLFILLLISVCYSLICLCLFCCLWSVRLFLFRVKPSENGQFYFFLSFEFHAFFLPTFSG